MPEKQRLHQWSEFMDRVRGLGFEYQMMQGRECRLPEYHMTVGWALKPKMGLYVRYDDGVTRYGLRPEEIL